jgi:hypothetical protein
MRTTFGGGGTFTSAGSGEADDEAPPDSRTSRNVGVEEEPPAEEDGLASRHRSPLERPTWGCGEGEESGTWEEREACGCMAERVAVGP